MYRSSIATFRGKHNESKSKALITLLSRNEQGLGGLTLEQLARGSSVSYQYLKSRLGKWHQWKYVTRRIASNGTRPVYTYSIAERGEVFVKIRIPPDILAKYLADLKEYHNNQLKVARVNMGRYIQSGVH